MRYKLLLDDKAIAEAQEAYDYYEEQLSGLGDRFKGELDKCVSYIQKKPAHFKKVRKI